MAFITLAGTLRDPTSELAVGDQIRFTHKSTTGETVEGAVSVLTIDPSGTYSKDLQYGLVLVEYKDVRASQFKNLGVATVNGSNPASSIPELLNALVPVSSAELIEFQAILADAVTARNEAEAFANSIDLINDLSQAYIFDTVAEYKASTILFPVGKTIHLNDRDADFAVIAGTGTATGSKIISSNTTNSSISLILSGGVLNSNEWGVSTVNSGAINTLILNEMIEYGYSLYLGGSVGGGGVDVYTPAGLYDFEGVIDKSGVNRSGDGKNKTVFQLVGDNNIGMSCDALITQTTTGQCAWGKFKGFSIVPKNPSVLLPVGQVMFDATGYSRSNFDDVYFGFCGGVIGIKMTGATLAGSGGPANWYNLFTDTHVDRLASSPAGGTGWLLGDTDLSKEQITTWTVVGGRTSGAGSGTGVNIQGANTILFNNHPVEGCDENIIIGSTSGTRGTDNVTFSPLYIEGGINGITLHPNARTTNVFGYFISSFSGVDITDNGNKTTWVAGDRIVMQCQNNPDRWVVEIENAGASNIPTFKGSSPAIRLLDTVNGKSQKWVSTTQFSEATHAQRFFSGANELLRMGTSAVQFMGTKILFKNKSSFGWFTGSGSPEGVLTADMGSIYTNISGGANSTLYTKEVGVGNTGWVAK